MSMISQNPSFSLADLEAFDPRSSTRSGASSGRERRFLCPLCGDGKPKDRAHRSLCANLESGAWNCKRCKATGKLNDFCQERPRLNARELSRRRVAQAFALPEPHLREPQSPRGESMALDAKDWRDQLRDYRVLDVESSHAPETYLRRRGINLETAIAAGATFAPKFYGQGAVIFPICDRDGQQIGASGRYLHANATPKTRISGSKKNGIFSAFWVSPSGQIWKPFDARTPAVIITEAPIDALSIATSGFPAIAFCGTSAPSWIHLACGLKRVLLAFDADDAGDSAAAYLMALLTPYGARCERLRPEGTKDWNEALQRDSGTLRDWLAAKVLAANT